MNRIKSFLLAFLAFLLALCLCACHSPEISQPQADALALTTTDFSVSDLQEDSPSSAVDSSATLVTETSLRSTETTAGTTTQKESPSETSVVSAAKTETQNTAKTTQSVNKKPSSTTSTTKTTSKKTTTATTQKPKEKRSILIIGNSHSIDAFWLLYQAYMDQHPDTDLCVGILHYNGANISEHVTFGNTHEPVIRYYKNDSGWWKIRYNVTTESVLTDHPWDTILMQPAKIDLANSDLNQTGRTKLMALVDKYVKNPHQFMWHISWPSPNDETFFSPDYIRQPPEGYKERLTRLYGFNPLTQFNLMLDMTKKHILDDTRYSKSLCSGSAVMHALLTQNVPQLELWRDYTHLSDYGRLMVGYALTAQLTGEPIRSVGIDTIPVKWRHKQNKKQGDQAITADMKNVIIKAANYSIRNAWTMPPNNNPSMSTTTTTTTTTTATAADKSGETIPVADSKSTQAPDTRVTKTKKTTKTASTKKTN